MSIKLKRDEFKSLLKECILELVQEGKIFQGQMMAPAHQGHIQEQYGNPGDEGGSDHTSPNSRLEEAVRMTTNLVSKGNPKAAALYQHIIADTARNTLQKQLAGEMGMGGMGGGGLPATPEERALDQAQLGMFSASDRWAQLAFGKKPSAGR